MNALVNSQYEALNSLADQYQQRSGKECPVRYEKYTGQENQQAKHRIQQNLPHILLTNYVMLELMLVRPEEHNFVDHTATGLEFLVLDELHTYRGRQGADVALLIRRLRERCGNPNLLCIGTSATMVAGKATSRQERQNAISQFASSLFGSSINPEDIVEESLQRITSLSSFPSPDSLRKSLADHLPKSAVEMLKHPLTTWIEFTFGVEQEADGNLRRKTPLSLSEGAKNLSESTGIEVQACEERLREIFLSGSQIKMPDGNPFFAFKLHQFISQGRTVYATLEHPSARFLTLEGQYYAPSERKNGFFIPFFLPGLRPGLLFRYPG